VAIETHIIRAPWKEHGDALKKIREVVFIEEQQVPREIEWDGADDDSHHYLAINELGQMVGCARLMASGQIGRMAVLKEHRGNGIGAQLLDEALAHAKELGFDEVFLHAQTYALDFYRKAGFVPFGDEFTEAGIPHIAMKLIFPLAFAPPEGSTDTTPELRFQPVRDTLANDQPQTATFRGLQETRDHLLRVIRAARRRVLILSPILEEELFDGEELTNALSELARSGRRAEVRILIFDSKLIVQRGHRIVELARRLDEKIKIRLVEQTYDTKTSTFVSADLDAYWMLPNHEVYEGISDLADPVTTKRLNETFETLWEKSREDPELRILNI
jgi:predicted GNAT family N-acyltransferase